MCDSPCQKMENIQIRKYKNQDIPAFYEAVMESKAEISRWLPWCNADYSFEDTQNWIQKLVPQIWASNSGCEFIIVDSLESKVLGGCCLEQLDLKNKKASIGYWVRTSATGRGIATKACHFLLTYGFETLALNLIYVIPSVKNEASKRVAEKLPYDKLDRVVNGFKIREEISDALVYTFSRNSYISYKK